MKHILVTGCKGQLGNEIQLLASKYDDTCKFYFTDKDELDITDRKAVYAFIEQNHISIVVNCAAFTAVDKAESNEELCNLLNNIAPGYLAEAVASVGGTMIQVSTDYVFDGNSCKPYKEEDATNPQTVYGRTKLAGEENVIRSCAGSMVIRTAWLLQQPCTKLRRNKIRAGLVAASCITLVLYNMAINQFGFMTMRNTGLLYLPFILIVPGVCVLLGLLFHKMGKHPITRFLLKMLRHAGQCTLEAYLLIGITYRFSTIVAQSLDTSNRTAKILIAMLTLLSAWGIHTCIKYITNKIQLNHN